jgi:hypothetical protein
MLPGVFFVLWGCWQTLLAICLPSQQDQQQQQLSPPRLTRCQQRLLDLEVFGKVVFPAVGMLAELWQVQQWGWDKLNVVMHICLYAGFFGSGLGDCALRKRAQHCYQAQRLQALLSAAAFANEWLLFYSHANSQQYIEAAFHNLLLVSISLAVVICLLSAAYQTQTTLARATLGVALLLQGSWFIEIAFLLFGYDLGPEHEFDWLIPNADMFITSLFSVHLLLSITLIGGALGLSACLQQHLCGIKASSDEPRHGFIELGQDPHSSSEEDEADELTNMTVDRVMMTQVSV